MNKLVKLILIGVILNLPILAEEVQKSAVSFNIYTQIGQYINDRNSVLWYRDSQINFSNLPYDLGIKLLYKVYDGLGFVGGGDNYRVGIHISREFNLIDIIGIVPHIGGSFNGSNSISGVSFSSDVGLGLNYKPKLFGIVEIITGGEVLYFENSYQIEYYGGPKIIILPNFSISFLYTGLFSHQTTIVGDYNPHLLGYGVLLEFKF
jgi:hypothetical protein